MQHEEEIKSFAAKRLSNENTGHNMNHINRVVRTSKTLLKKHPEADEQIVLTSAYLHDTYDDKLFDDVLDAKKEVKNFLASININSQPIFEIIDHMSWSAELENPDYVLDINGQLVQDADRLDAMGAIGVVRTFIFGNTKKRITYDPNIHPRDIKNKEEYRNSENETTINHFYEKVFKLPEGLNTQYAKELGQQRNEYSKEFVEEFIGEWLGDK